MSIQELDAQAMADRAERRKHWATFRQLSPSTLEELLRKPANADQLASLQEYVLLDRRERKGQLETQEKIGESRERAALPLAAAVSFLGSWSAGLSLVPLSWKPGTVFAFGLLGSLLWWFIRESGYKLIINARKGLAQLGKVD
jgi:hypothetical protein